mgnify:CR=1 FL=1
MWENYGKTFIEYVYLSSFKKKSNHIIIKNREAIRTKNFGQPRFTETPDGRIFEVMDTITKTNHGVIEFIVVANTKWFNSLSSKHKEIIVKSAEIAEKDVRDKVAKIEDEAYKLGEEKGMKIVTPSKSDIDAYKAASKPVYDDYKKNAGSLGAQLLDAASKL